MNFQEKTNESITQKGSYNFQQTTPIRFSRVHSRIMTMTRSSWKNRKVHRT